jgi:integrase
LPSTSAAPSIGSTSDGTTDKTAAQELHDKVKHDLRRVERLEERPEHSWEEATLRWLEEKDSKRTIADDALMIKSYTKHFKKWKVHALTAEEIHAATRKITDGKVYYNRHLALMCGILNRAVRHWGWLEKVPALITKSEPKRRIRYLRRDEANRLLKELPNHLKDMVEFSLHTGLRQSNVMGLRWDQVDMRAKMVIVSAEDFKNGRDHSVPLNDIAIDIIMRNIGRNMEYVFTYQGRPVSQVNTKAFRDALKRAGILNFRWHDLRHTWASWLIQAGVPIEALQELRGWESREMVRRYAHFDRGHLAQFVGRLEGTNSPTAEHKRKTG